MILERFHKCCSGVSLVEGNSGLFDFWLRFISVTGFSNLSLRRSLAKKSKILAAHCYIISVNAPALPGGSVLLACMPRIFRGDRQLLFLTASL